MKTAANAAALFKSPYYKKYSPEEIAKTEIRSFVNDGLQDVSNNRLLDFDTVFDELEERYGVDE
ncbi:MAG: hypothetical protein K2P50_08755 [Lachnospiraceae bacterium]|nr:hypothetical protein [Lachnospiraceae bacterium]